MSTRNSHFTMMQFTDQIVDYEAQASFLERIFEKFHKGNVSSILDVGCGTGNYTFVFANRGYRTAGIDLVGRHD